MYTISSAVLVNQHSQSVIRIIVLTIELSMILLTTQLKQPSGEGRTGVCAGGVSHGRGEESVLSGVLFFYDDRPIESGMSSA